MLQSQKIEYYPNKTYLSNYPSKYTLNCLHRQIEAVPLSTLKSQQSFCLQKLNLHILHEVTYLLVRLMKTFSVPISFTVSNSIWHIVISCLFLLKNLIKNQNQNSKSILIIALININDSRWLKGDYTLDGILAECRGDIGFLLLHVRKGLFTNTFLKCRFRWKVEIISTFPLRTNVAFFLNQPFLRFM